MENRINAFNSPSELLHSGKLSKIKYLLGLLVCIGCSGLNILAAPWDLDPTFGSGGKVIANLPVRGQGMALQTDGKIVMVGGVGGSGVYGYTVARFNADGSLDTTFDGDGTASITFGGTTEIASTVAVQPDGKIVVGGTTYLSNYNSIAIARLNPNGSLDTTFNSSGKLTRSISANSIPYYVSCSTVKVANDGKIVFAGGGVRLNPSGDYALMGRLNADGSFDTTFDGDGILFGAVGKWLDLSIQADGSIVAVGDNTLTWMNQMKSVKIANNGSTIWSYSRGGEFQFMSLKGVAAQADGKFIAVGNFSDRIVAIRLNADGTLDNTFTEATNTPFGEGKSVAVQADGKIVANVLLANNGTNGDGFSLIRYNADGTIDTSFGNNGIVTTRVGTDGNETGKNLIIQPDGKILVGGSFNSSSFVMVRYLGSSAAPVRAKFDYDGDGKADVSVFRPSDGSWYILNSSNSSYTQRTFGVSGDVPVPADYDGDGKTDMAIFRPSLGDWWYISSASGSYIAAHWGQNGDIPQPADYDSDNKADFVVYRPSNGTWYFLRSNGNSSVILFGTAEDKPVIGDFDGDGKADYAVYRPSTGVWWYAASGSLYVQRAVQFGVSTDVPVPADYDGDGKTDFAVYRPSNGGWHILKSSNGSYTALQFGTAEDKPVAADYDGDGKADVGVFRPSNGSWYLLRSAAGFSGIQWGASADIPTESSFVQ